MANKILYFQGGDVPCNILNEVTDLTFCHIYNQPNTKLPSKIKILRLGNYFNQKIELVEGLEIIYFGCYFNQDVVFPETIKEIYFSGTYNRPTFLPASTQRVIFGAGCFNNLITAKEGLKEIHLANDFDLSIDGMIPLTVEKIMIGNKFNQPVTCLSKHTNLVSLTLGNSFDQNIDMLPDNIKILSIGNSFNSGIGKLSQQLESLTIGNMFNQPLNNILRPLKKLSFLSLGNEFCHPLNINDCSIITLIVGEKFNHSLHSFSKVTNLTIGEAFSHPSHNYFPCLKYLIIPKGKQQLFNISNIPYVSISEKEYHYPTVNKIAENKKIDEINILEEPVIIKSTINHNSEPITMDNYVVGILDENELVDLLLNDHKSTIISNVKIEKFLYVKIPNGSRLLVNDIPMIISNNKEGLESDTPQEKISPLATIPKGTIVHLPGKLAKKLKCEYQVIMQTDFKVKLNPGTWVKYLDTTFQTDRCSVIVSGNVCDR